MIELIDNLSQFIVALLAMSFTGVLFYKNRKQVYFLLACFYGLYTLGVLYWTIYYLMNSYTPQIFYVSDLSWTISFFFLLTLELTLSKTEEKKFRHPAMWLVPIVCVPLMIFYMKYGDIVTNFLWCGITMASGWLAVRGLIYARRQNGKARNMQYFHAVVLGIVVMEYCLWTASCFWISDTLTNPYFWFDFILTAFLFALLPATRKAVGE